MVIMRGNALPLSNPIDDNKEIF